MGKLFYIMGKSASGKDTIYQRLLRNPEFSLERLVIYTTRPIRDGELDGREYHFVTEEDFQKLKAEGKIIEDRGYETVYGLWRYFTADNMNLEEKSYLGIGTLESYEKLKAYYGEEKIRPIYIEVEDGERLKRASAKPPSTRHAKRGQGAGFLLHILCRSKPDPARGKTTCNSTRLKSAG